MQTSFNKKPRGKSNALQINGTQSSLHNGQLLCSTGIPSLDGVIGGGIPVGTVFLLEEDHNHQYSDVLTRYFLAEAVVSSHEVFIVGNDDESSFTSYLPKPVMPDEDSHTTEANAGDMKIAWRYQNSPQVQTSIGKYTKYGHYYDISKHMDEEMLNNTKIKYVDLRHLYHKESEKPPDLFKDSLKELHKYIVENNFDAATALQAKKPLNILRVVIHSFLSPSWGCIGENDSDDQNFIRFLVCLRGILRKSLAVCWVTVPTHILSSINVKLLRHYTDMVVKLEAFGKGKTNPLYKDYHGLLKIKKLPVLNCILPYMPDTYDLAFKLRRKRFAVERLHLPPDITESASRQGVEEETGLSVMNVSHSNKKSVDF
uniref:elongator complex protein 4-like n=1 Tax=Styela clava TaxID=7725 RepID=UPI0019394E4E|nr:elongator complex protein 4-like [Styela clava]